MPTVLVPAQLSVEHLMTIVKQLSPAELHEFAQQFMTWHAHRSPQTDDEALLLASIAENSSLPAVEQRRYKQLRRKCARRTLTTQELAEYQELLRQLEIRNVRRMEALIALAQRRGTTLEGVMAELGLPSPQHAE